MKLPHSPRLSNPTGSTPPNEDGPVSLVINFFKRDLDEDVFVRGDDWLKESGVQRQLEFKGYQLRWVSTTRLDANLADGWQFVTVPHYLWWMKRIRRRHGRQSQYLLKRTKSFRGAIG